MSPSERTTKIGLQGFTPPSVEIIAAEFPALEIVELIGAGGMGAVYKARQPELDRMVALKILPEGIGEGFNAEERFDREAKAMAALSHPNLVPIFEYGRSNDASFAYFLMEFIDGKSLHEEIAENGAMEPTRAANLIGQICAGLEYAHSRGIIHRDIKAANILVDPDDRVRIVDFGLVK
ncbi:MAG: serine/threonine-protein kinase, partial [Verrucomicrobiota bacterium]